MTSMGVVHDRIGPVWSGTDHLVQTAALVSRHPGGLTAGGLTPGGLAPGGRAPGGRAPGGRAPGSCGVLMRALPWCRCGPSVLASDDSSSAHVGPQPPRGILGGGRAVEGPHLHHGASDAGTGGAGISGGGGGSDSGAGSRAGGGSDRGVGGGVTGPPGAGFAHEPVMVREVVELLESVGPGIVVDATVGAGGHAAALLQASPDIEVVGLDADADAVQAARSRLERFGGRVVVRQARFDRIAEVLADLAVAAGTVRGVLFDLGVSSPQLDQPDRGFSYRSDAPLDMRMDRRRSRTAADVVNHWPEDRLAELFAENGEQRLARRIARAVVAARPLHTTGDLATVVAAAVPAPARRRGHPARRVFQAVRIAVNDELTVLADALPAAIDLLAPGGRCVVISYHSGEDRIVKAILRDAATGGCRCPVGLPCVCGARPSLRLLGRSARRPTAAEIAANHRAESARLRAGERLAGDGGVSASDPAGASGRAGAGERAGASDPAGASDGAGAGDPARDRAGDGPGRRRPRAGDAP